MHRISGHLGGLVRANQRLNIRHNWPAPCNGICWLVKVRSIVFPEKMRKSKKLLEPNKCTNNFARTHKKKPNINGSLLVLHIFNAQHQLRIQILARYRLRCLSRSPGHPPWVSDSTQAEHGINRMAGYKHMKYNYMTSRHDIQFRFQQWSGHQLVPPLPLDSEDGPWSRFNAIKRVPNEASWGTWRTYGINTLSGAAYECPQNRLSDSL